MELNVRVAIPERARQLQSRAASKGPDMRNRQAAPYGSTSLPSPILRIGYVSKNGTYALAELRAREGLPHALRTAFEE